MRESWMIGSGEGSDLVVDLPGVSRVHCRLERAGDGFVLEDLGSSNGTFVNGRRIESRIPVSRRDSITLGRSAAMPWPGESISDANALIVGRDEGSDVLLDVPMVSGRHAVVRWDPGRGQATVEDLGSSNGTSIGAPGRREGPTPFSAGDTVYFGSHGVSGAWLLGQLRERAPRSLAFRGDSMVLGRDPGCDRVIDAQQVSGRHARLTREGDRVRIEDLGSTNGTTVNGRPVRGPEEIRDGDRIGLGTYELLLAIEPISATGERPEVVPAGPDSDRSTVPLGASIAALAGQSLLIALAIVAVGRSAAPEVRAPQIAFWLGIAAVWFGLGSAPMIALLDRARRAPGIAPSYVAALAVACIAQSAVAWWTVALGTGLRAAPLPSIALMSLAAWAGLGLGWGIVAASPHPSWAVGGAVAAIALAALLGGGRSASGPTADAVPSRWAYEGLLLLEAEARPDAPDPAAVAFPVDSRRSGLGACGLALALSSAGLIAAAAFIAMGPGSASRPRTPSPRIASAPR